MTYDRVVKGVESSRTATNSGPTKEEWTLTAIKSGNKSNMQRESTRRRLVGLEAKYGVFPADTDENITMLNHSLPDNSTFRHPEDTIFKNHASCSQERSSTSRIAVQNSYELLRKGTRPPLPPPGHLDKNRIPVPIPYNMYETIDDIGDAGAIVPPQRVSYDTVTPDDYSSTNEFQKLSQKDMYSRTPSMYDEAGIDFRVCDVQYNSKGDIMNKNNMQYVVSEVSSISSSAENICGSTNELPENSENTTKSGLLNNDSTCSLHSDHHNHPVKTNPRHRLLQSQSHHHISSEHSLQHTISRYPQHASLPDVLEANDYISLDSDCSHSVESSIQDTDSYLRPRPSFPDTSITPAYSSSEDVSEMRRRLLKAAHPSLLDNPRDLAFKMGSNQRLAWYDSPRPSFDDTAFNSQIKMNARYDSPRSSNA